MGNRIWDFAVGAVEGIVTFVCLALCLLAAAGAAYGVHRLMEFLP